ncbi:MAG: YegS/Rv2252/BmrU family lipid kinase, partial [Oscillospiraceae bacterium]|nr:YegS/Rv2252/BmrU family lipid kinase [Oscillospiraceae bacterium]
AREPDEYFRFYACGGDGTVYEVANGVYSVPNAEFAVIPLGSGNDFVRVFGGKAVFLNIENVILGEATEIDCIDCGNGQIAVNQCSMGFDAEACVKQIKYKRNPFLTGETAYIAAMLNRFLTRMGEIFQVEIDGVPYDSEGRRFLLCAVANSRWYGGGFMVAPRAMPDDGYLDCMIIKMRENKFQMLRVATLMRKGEHLGFPHSTYIRCKKVRILAQRDSAVNIDGEIDTVRESCFEIREKAIKFVLPLGHTYNEVSAKWLADETTDPVQTGIG